jgi:hypothetical protein
MLLAEGFTEPQRMQADVGADDMPTRDSEERRPIPSRSYCSFREAKRCGATKRGMSDLPTKSKNDTPICTLWI